MVAACLGAAVAGIAEGLWQGFGLLAAIASAGFASILVVPLLFAGALLVRGLWAAWRPRELAPGLIEDGGGAPRLAGWIIFLAAATFVISWTTFNGVRLLSQITTFKVNVVAVAMPAIVVTTGIILAAVSRPMVGAIAALVRDLDRAWRVERGAVAYALAPLAFVAAILYLVVVPFRPLLRRRLRASTKPRSLFAPRQILAATISLALGLLVFAWFKTIKPLLANVDAGVFLEPQLAAGLCALAHPVPRRLSPRVRRFAAIGTGAITALVIAASFWLRYADPSMMLAIWAEPSIGGLAIDTVYDTDDLRSRAMVEKYKPADKPGAIHRDIILVTIDTVRWDHTPMGGGKAAVMPAIAQLAKQAVVFDRDISPSNVTRRSMPAMILGESSPRVRGRVVGWALKLDPRHVPLAERLQIAGYDTAGFFCCSSFWDPDKKTGYSHGLAHVFIDTDGENLGEEARKWVTERYAQPTTTPAFAWLHFIEPHNWMKRKDGTPDDAKLAARDARNKKYDRALTEVDTDLAGLIAAIQAVPEDRRPILIITSDHGEGLGDHGAPYHSSDLYETQTHVPLLIAGPGLPPHHVTETVSGTDLAPTILELAGFTPPGMPDMDGVSIADLATGARNSDLDGGFAYSVMIQDRSTSQAARAVVVGRWKLIDGPNGKELFDDRADPQELHSVYDQQPEVVAQLQALLDARAKIDETPPF